MPVPTLITDLDTVAANNDPIGSESVGNNVDNYVRAYAAFIAQVYAGETGISDGIVKATSGTMAPAVAGTDYLAPAAIGVTVQAYDADIATVAGTAAEIATGTQTALRSWSPAVLNDALAAASAPQSIISYTGTGGITSKGATLATTGTFPSDNTIPQNTEGNPLLDVTITPSVSGVVIEVEVNIQGYASGAANGCVALFQDSTADAIGGRSFYHDSGNRPYTYSFKERITAPNTTPITFKVRGGGNTGTMNWNGNLSTATMGGIFNGYVKATEVVFP